MLVGEREKDSGCIAQQRLNRVWVGHRGGLGSRIFFRHVLEDETVRVSKTGLSRFSKVEETRERRSRSRSRSRREQY